MTEPRLIGEVVLEPGRRVKVRVGEVNGCELVDVRVFVRDEKLVRVEHSTKSGFAIPKDRVPAPIQALRDALED